MALNTPLATKSSANHLDWEEYFMAIAILAAQRSKDPRTQVGACIVNEDKCIVGIGYNAMPRGCSDDIFPWVKNKHDLLNSKLTYVSHAELNAIVKKKFTDKNCTLYVTLFPCEECAKLIIQSRIKKVVYGSDKCGRKRIATTSKNMLEAAEIDRIQHDEKKANAPKRMSETTGVETQQYIPKRKKIEIDLTGIKGIQVPSTSLEKDPHGNCD